ncbi:hypothetical protein [Aestuariivirga sp.]|uniref:hypothetical protein n=1 Tax=Aestuariivirga sp. TaxID=2650926 RepID=UPI0039E6948E
MVLNASNTQTPDQIVDEAPDSPVAEDTTASIDQQSSSGVDLQPAKKELDLEDGEGKSQAWRDDKRNAIFAKAKAKREESVIPFEGNNNDPNVLYGSTADQSELSDLERQAVDRAKQVRQREIDSATGQQSRDDQQQDNTEPARAKRLADMDPNFARQRVTVVIDGQEREATIEELVRSAQMNGAADKRLTAAEEVLRRAQELRHAAENQRRDAGQHEQHQDQAQQQLQERQTSAPDFRTLAEKIQLGTAEEAAEAMEQFATATRASAQPSPSHGEDDSQRLRRVLEEQASEEALMKFGNENPDVAQDPMFQSVVANFTHRAMIEDLARAGVPQDTLRTIVQDPVTLTDTHKKARAMRIPGIRGAGELLQAGLAGARDWRSGQRGQPQAQNQRPAPQAPMSQPSREERRAAIQTQPAARRMIQPQGQGAVSQEQNRSRSVAEIRKARGQPA